ncbi:MAG TPA: ABC transporter substrate-binding protein [Ktedonobacteraceae bacterium]|jgi:ribose transport system substrate-binding protein
MKRLWTLFAAACVLASLLAACGPTAASSSTGSTSSTPTIKKGPYTIGLSVFFQGNSWQAENTTLLEQACKNYGAGVIKSCFVENANSSTTQQIAQIHDMINKKVDAILLDANSETGLNGVVQQALDAGIPVINYDSLVTGNATVKINTNQEQWGQVTAQWLVQQLHGQGNIVVLNGQAGSPVNNARYVDAQKIFAQNKGIHVLNVAYDNWDQATAQSSVSQMLGAYPKIDGVWSQGGAMTAGAMLEFQKAGRPLVPMTGEAYNGFLRMWSQNLSKGFTSIAPGQPNYLITLSLDAAVHILQGKKVPATVNVPLPVITDQTVKQYYRADEPDSYWVLDHISQADEAKLLGN